MISASSSSSGKTEKALQKMKMDAIFAMLPAYGEMGVSALSAATPREEGVTANSWYYTLERGDGGFSIVWRNSHVDSYANVAVLIQYGHGTRNGGYVEGRDYINPATQGVFDKASADIWKAVNS